VFQVSPILAVFGYLVIAVLGSIIGVLSGMLASKVFKLRMQGITKDAFTGAIGSVAAVIACAVVPWPRNTISESLGAGLRVETIMNRFQHPYLLATLVAVIVPALHQFIRFRKARRSQDVRQLAT
jgi:uncharacterized membrane protein YeaQ/YmgE (transglycosylase-associated protein family)